jgi:phosphatidate phosphatase APP1
MAANPQLGYVLMGDTGQHDAMVYRDAVLRHPGRVMAVVLREPGPGPDAQSRAAMDEIRGAGVPVLSAVDFAGVAPSIDAIAAQD